MTGGDKTYEFWLPLNGETVVIDGVQCVIEVRGWWAKYPRTEWACTVHAQPDKTDPAYRAMKQKFRDDWAHDLIASYELTEDVLGQLTRKGWKLGPDKTLVKG